MKEKISEKEFTAMVIKLAKFRGWRVAHFRTSLSQSGRWLTAVQGDGKGFPDLILLRGGQIMAIELKVGNNKTSPEQYKWLEEFFLIPGAWADVWRPENWPHIEYILERGVPQEARS